MGIVGERCELAWVAELSDLPSRMGTNLGMSVCPGEE